MAEARRGPAWRSSAAQGLQRSGPRKDFGGRDRSERQALAEARRSAGGDDRPRVLARRATIARRGDRPFRDAAEVRRPIRSPARGSSEVRSSRRPMVTATAMTARNSIVRASAPKAAPTGRSIRATRAASAIVRAATTRTTARSSPSARRSAAAAPIASASRTSAVRARRPPKPKKAGERIAKVMARAGPRLAPRGRGLDRGGPRRGQRRGDHLAGAQRHARATASPSTASRCRRASARGCSSITSRAAS